MFLLTFTFFHEYLICLFGEPLNQYVSINNISFTLVLPKSEFISETETLNFYVNELSAILQVSWTLLTIMMWSC